MDSPQTYDYTPRSVLCLFSGIGALSELGIRSAGLENHFRVHQFVELDSFRQKILSLRFPGIPIHGDIRTYRPTFKPFVIVGGFPCRGTSIAGRRTGLLNEYSNLWFEMLRVIDECRPPFVLIENVAGFIDMGLRAALGGLRVAGYHWDAPLLVSASILGAPHRRDRIFVVAYADGACSSERFLQLPWARQAREEIARAWRDRETRRAEHTRISGMDAGTAAWLDGYRRGGWWHRNEPYYPAKAPSRSIKHRGKRVQTIGDSCTPEQAKLGWSRIAYLSGILDITIEELGEGPEQERTERECASSPFNRASE